MPQKLERRSKRKNKQLRSLIWLVWFQEYLINLLGQTYYIGFYYISSPLVWHQWHHQILLLVVFIGNFWQVFLRYEELATPLLAHCVHHKCRRNLSRQRCFAKSFAGVACNKFGIFLKLVDVSLRTHQFVGHRCRVNTFEWTRKHFAIWRSCHLLQLQHWLIKQFKGSKLGCAQLDITAKTRHLKTQTEICMLVGPAWKMGNILSAVSNFNPKKSNADVY